VASKTQWKNPTYPDKIPEQPSGATPHPQNVGTGVNAGVELRKGPGSGYYGLGVTYDGENVTVVGKAPLGNPTFPKNSTASQAGAGGLDGIVTFKTPLGTPATNNQNSGSAAHGKNGYSIFSTITNPHAQDPRIKPGIPMPKPRPPEADGKPPGKGADGSPAQEGGRLAGLRTALQTDTVGEYREQRGQAMTGRCDSSWHRLGREIPWMHSNSPARTSTQGKSRITHNKWNHRHKCLSFKHKTWRCV